MTEKRKIAFDFGGDEEEPVAEKVESVTGPIHGTDPSSPEEQARRFEEVMKDPPISGYNKVELYEAKDKDGNIILAMPDPEGPMEAINGYTGDKFGKVQVFDQLFEIDLAELYAGQLSETSINVIPTLIDEACGLVADEKKEWNPAKPKKDFTQWWWLLIVASFVPMILFGISMLSGMW